MKTIVAISDTHGDKTTIKQLLPILQEADYVFFLGDGILDLGCVEGVLGDKLVAVCGNCDGVCGGEPYKVVEIEGHRIALTHGHLYGVKYNTNSISKQGINEDVIFFGHTHSADINLSVKPKLVNVGSLNRKNGNEQSYIYAVVDENIFFAKIVKLR